MKTAFCRRKTRIIWNRLENFVPLQCRKERWEIAPRPAKILFQACKNFLPAQGAKMEVRKSANELINLKLQIFDFFITILQGVPLEGRKRVGPRGTSKSNKNLIKNLSRKYLNTFARTHSACREFFINDVFKH